MPDILGIWSFRFGKVAPDWSARWRGMLDRRGSYFASQSRLQSNAEAICAYQGNVQERAIIEGEPLTLNP
jgi:hypothetical protein